MIVEKEVFWKIISKFAREGTKRPLQACTEAFWGRAVCYLSEVYGQRIRHQGRVVQSPIKVTQG